MTERIVGPVRGYYIASYACAMGEFGRQFLGFAKLCSQPPSDFWDAKSFAEFTTSELLDSVEGALANVEQRAMARIAQLPKSD